MDDSYFRSQRLIACHFTVLAHLSPPRHKAIGDFCQQEYWEIDRLSDTAKVFSVAVKVTEAWPDLQLTFLSYKPLYVELLFVCFTT